MKPIMERCDELHARLERLRRVKENEARAQALEVRRAEIEKERAELSLVAASAHVLLAHGHLAVSALPDCAKALESCDKVEALLDPDPTAITKGRDYRYLLRRVGKVRDALLAVTKESWQTVVSQHQGVDEAFLRRVEQFPGQGQTVAKIREHKRAFDESTGGMPVGEEDYKRFAACYAELQQALEKLDPDAFPDDVLEFFRAAQQANGAPLSLFTDSVRDWLDKNGFIGGVRVRFTGER